MLHKFLLLLALAVGGHAAAWAQGTALAPTGAAASAPRSVAPAPAMGGIQSANIFQIAPDATTDPKYAEQTNAERAKVQPGNNAPMWRAVGSGVTGYSSLPKSEAPEAGNLIQPMVQYPGSRLTTAGEAWRQVRNQWLIPYGGALLLIALVALVLLYLAKGPLGESGNTGPKVIERFTPFERAAHWINAIAFCLLGVSGVVMAFGKFFLQPVLGLHLFGWLSFLLKNIHNFAGPVFAVSLVVVLITFLKDNIASIWDLRWLTTAGGMLGGKQVPSHRFNPAEKGMYWWGMFVPGLLAVGTGLVLDRLIPGWGETRGQMQVAHMIHLVATVIMMSMLLGHIYMGTVGVRGAYSAMRTGWVDEAWAREHHQLWCDDVATGKIAAQRSGVGPNGERAANASDARPASA
ncbi:MAG: formate dehydrogenase subunit gamma [Proteobacteria bacterium]|jgi:formate dehydrogenase subunit gamma|nr:formate dehydrogenase subunit gamma [Pseudomonadota bacterium]